MGGFEVKYEWWEYFLIPWIAAFVGYFTNVIALEMTFYPIEYWGFNWYRYRDEPWGLFGWQGIIPSKAEKMASISFELFTKKLFNMKEIFNRLNPVRFSEVMGDSILLMMDSIIQEVAMEYMPAVWEKLPQAVKDDVVVLADHEGEAFMAEFMKDMQDHVDDVVDIKHMTVSACVANKRLIVQIFQECGDKEFTFIRRSGFYFGFLLGIFQLAVWFVYDAPWTLPACGFIVGWLTNYIALKVIFRPLRPVKFLCWTLHGIFIKRQKEVAAIFSRVVITEILHVQAIWDAIFTGPLSSNFFAMLRAHTLVFTEKMIAEIKPIAVAALGAEKFACMKEDIAQKVIDKLPSIIDRSYAYTQEALDMEKTVREKMQELSPEDFEGVLHPAFEEDEIELIALGGILGAIVGVIQLSTLFA
jgi:uncharacterized membrane protein YheB (UPF0754 family)